MKRLLLTVIASLLWVTASAANDERFGPLDRVLEQAREEVENGNFVGFVSALDPTGEQRSVLASVVAVLEQHLSEEPEFRVLFVDYTGHDGWTVISTVINQDSAMFFATTYITHGDGLRLIHFSGQGAYKDILQYR